jgi:hypothetical protein
MTIRGHAAVEPGRPREPFAWEPGAFGATDLDVEVKCCGVRHRISTALRLDEPVPAHRVSIAKKVAARFKMSRS